MNRLPPTWQEQNEERWLQLDFVLVGRSAATVIWITCNSFRHRQRLFHSFKERYSQFQHLELYLDDYAAGSVPAFIRSGIPADALAAEPGKSVLHLFGIEKHLQPGGQEAPTGFFKALNFERELLFRSFPFPIVFGVKNTARSKPRCSLPTFGTGWSIFSTSKRRLRHLTLTA
ncbi:MAG: hypothetical protein IPN33_07885 [Saprospiraceae bacterium]|nr:hypothetical protein [Saprospiraceae bacterium]